MNGYIRLHWIRVKLTLLFPLEIDTHEGVAGRFSVSSNMDYDQVARVDGNNFPVGQWGESGRIGRLFCRNF